MLFANLFGLIRILRNLSWMLIGAFIALAFYAPDQFTELKSLVETLLESGVAYAREVDLDTVGKRITELSPE